MQGGGLSSALQAALGRVKEDGLCTPPAVFPAFLPGCAVSSHTQGREGKLAEVKPLATMRWVQCLVHGELARPIFLPPYRVPQGRAGGWKGSQVKRDRSKPWQRRQTGQWLFLKHLGSAAASFVHPHADCARTQQLRASGPHQVRGAGLRGWLGQNEPGGLQCGGLWSWDGDMGQLILPGTIATV